MPDKSRFVISAAMLLFIGSGCSQNKPEPRPETQQESHRESQQESQLKSPIIDDQAALPLRQRLDSLADSVTIYRDAYGVPHVYGPTDASVVFGATYARAEDEFHYIEQAYIKMLGRAAAVSGAEWLDWDIFLRKLEIEAHSKQEYLSAPPTVRALCEAFADGMNYFLMTHPEVKARSIHHFEPWHALAGYRIFHLSGIGGATLQQLGVPGVLDPFTGYLASTFWAIGPSKSTSGAPMLLINPHIPLDAPYEVSMHSDEGLNVSGQMAYGIGILPISGHNGDIAFAITANEPDINDVYRETFDTEDPLSYRYGQRWMQASRWQQIIAVRTDSGVEQRSFTFEKSRNGPLFVNEDGERLALKVAKLAHGGILEQFYDMSRAKNLEEFKQAIAPMHLTYNNIAYAGRDGHIFYVYGGAIAKRSPQFDWSEPVEGSDPATDWGSFLSLQELPQVEDPTSGYIQNSNSSPFFTTDDENPDTTAFPTFLFRGKERDTGIARHSRKLLGGPEKISFEQWSQLAFDTYLPTADGDIADLNSELNKLRLEDLDKARGFDEPMHLLNDWDRRSRVDSVATTLYITFFHTNAKETDYPMLGRLQQSLDRLKRHYGTWRTAYGDFTRLQRLDPASGENYQDAAPSVPVAGLPFYTGAIFTVNTTGTDDGTRYYGQHGHSFVGVVELSNPVRARSVMAFGQSRDPQSPHFFDQAALYAQGQLKTAWFDREQVEQHAIRVYHPGAR